MNKYYISKHEGIYYLISHRKAYELNKQKESLPARRHSQHLLYFLVNVDPLLPVK